MADDLDLLRQATDEWGTRLRQVQDDQWARPTPCVDWTVRQLVNHIVVGDEMTGELLAGRSAEDVLAGLVGDRLGTDPIATWGQASAGELAAFAEPDALTRTVHHPGAGDIPGTVLFTFRLADNLVHAWDLARAIGADETLDADLVAATWEALQPMAPMMPVTGVFGTGASGTLGADAPLQDRLLDLSGRRP